MIKPPPNVMTFSATDPSGGAGLQADVQTISSLNCHPVSITTGFTVQDTTGVEKLISLDSELVNDQARLVLKDMKISVFKLGVLGSEKNIATIAKIISDYPKIPLIVDPILASGRGDNFLNQSARDLMMKSLLPKSLLITPNSSEAKLLVGIEGEDKNQTIEKCVNRFKEIGCQNVLITGADENTENVINTLYSSANQIIPYKWKRLPETYHGSGCTLTSAISAYYALGLSLGEAVEEAQLYVWKTLKNAFNPGKGQWIPNRFFHYNDDGDNGKLT
jgi:hydroxymethylpyrimidine/phosphomethylpyrimidine kinase|tara:strand:+ start:220 stop:1047 length:828 start_codon:yes stop_codon:yes gene_type:complete